VWPGGAGYRLTCCLAVVAMAGYGLVRPRACGRWLPVWLPEISLAALMFERAEAPVPSWNCRCNRPRLSVGDAASRAMM
jgi:hypothetical protein